MMQHRIQIPVQSQLVEAALNQLAEAISQPALLITWRPGAGVPAAAATQRLTRAPTTLQLRQQFVHVSTRDMTDRETAQPKRELGWHDAKTKPTCCFYSYRPFRLLVFFDDVKCAVLSYQA